MNDPARQSAAKQTPSASGRFQAITGHQQSEARSTSRSSLRIMRRRMRLLAALRSLPNGFVRAVARYRAQNRVTDDSKYAGSKRLAQPSKDTPSGCHIPPLSCGRYATEAHSDTQRSTSSAKFTSLAQAPSTASAIPSPSPIESSQVVTNAAVRSKSRASKRLRRVTSCAGR